MIFPNAPAMLSPAARHLIAGHVVGIRRALSDDRRTLQEAVDDLFSAIAYRVAYAAGGRAARALQVGDVFTGANPASVAYYGSTPTDGCPARVRLEHAAFRSGYLAALPPFLATCTQGVVLEMRRPVARTRAKDRGGFIVVRQDAPGTWTPVNARMIYPTLAAATDAARNPPVRRVA